MMKVRNAEALAALYDRDYLAWIEATTECLQQRDYSTIDWVNLIDEFSDLGREEKRRLREDIRGALTYLLMWQYQPEHRSQHWEMSILKHRNSAVGNLEDSPSLQSFLEREFSALYHGAVKVATAGTGLLVGTFPVDCPYAITQVLDEDFLPQ